MFKKKRPPTQIIVERVVGSDLDAVLLLEKSGYRKHYSKSKLIFFKDCPAQFVFQVACIGEILVGFYIYEVASEKLLRFFVDSRHRLKGAGRTMMKNLQQIIADNPERRIIATVRANNLPTLNFLKKLDFKPEEIIPSQQTDDMRSENAQICCNNKQPDEDGKIRMVFSRRAVKFISSAVRNRIKQYLRT